MNSWNVLKRGPWPSWVPATLVWHGHGWAGRRTGRRTGRRMGRAKTYRKTAMTNCEPKDLGFYWSVTCVFRKVFAALYWKTTVHCSYVCSLQVLLCFPGGFPHELRKRCIWKIARSARAGSYCWGSSPVTPLTRPLQQLISSKPWRCFLGHDIER